MVEAIPSLTPSRAQRQAQQQADRARRAVRIEALRRAREEVKAQIRREGRIKVCSVPSHEITAMAEAYVLAHRELIAEARARVDQWRVEGFFGKAAQISEDMSKEERPVTQELLVNETHAQNGAVE
jgi:hypothetical protein